MYVSSGHPPCLWRPPLSPIACAALAHCSWRQRGTAAPRRVRHSPRTAAAAATQPAATGAASPDAADGAAWMLRRELLPGRYVGPVECVLIEGKGRGVRATRPVAAGELLLLVPPLAALAAPPDRAPTPAQLVDHVLAGGATSSSEAAGGPAASSPWLSLLYDGSPASCRRPVDLSRPGGGGAPEAAGAGDAGDAAAGADAPAAAAPAADFKGGKPGKGPRGKVVLGGKGAAGGGGGGGGAKRERQLLKKRVAKAVAYNAFADRHQDLALAALARAEAEGGGSSPSNSTSSAAAEEPAACVGLWPEFAMLNHSCAPNAINYPLHLAGGRPYMVVRAARDIPAGVEVTITYFGADQLIPLAPRRKALRESFGFDCACARCVGEAATWEAVGGTVEAVAEATAEMRPAFERATAAGDAAALHEARLEAGAMLLQLYGAFRQNLVRPATRLWHQASLYQTLEMAADADAALAALAERRGSGSSGTGGSGGGSDAGEGGGGGELPPGDTEESEAASVAACLTAIEAVSPGSDLHTQLAARALRLARRRRAALAAGDGAAEAAAAADADAAVSGAERRCVRAHELRYGPGLVASEGPRLMALSEELALQGLGQGLQGLGQGCADGDEGEEEEQDRG